MREIHVDRGRQWVNLKNKNSERTKRSNSRRDKNEHELIRERVSGEHTEWRAIAQAKRQQTHKQVVNWNPRDLLAMRIHAPIK